MHRRPVAPKRAASAAWARRFGIAGALVAVAAVLAAHHPRVPPRPALAILALGLGLAVLAALCGLKAMLTIWQTGRPGLGRALFGLLLAAATLAYPGYLGVRVSREPITAAVATSGSGPPGLSRSTKAVLSRGRYPADTEPPSVGAAPITLDMSMGDACDTIEDALRSLRWRVVETVPPGGRLGLAHIDAIAYSPVMHLPQDVAVRVTPLGDQVRIDVLSVSRLGVTDFGEGAKLIRQLGEAIDAQTAD